MVGMTGFEPEAPFSRSRRSNKRAIFLNITTPEKKNDFLLIETFRKLFNPQNQGRLGTGDLSSLSEFIVHQSKCLKIIMRWLSICNVERRGFSVFF
jgi:hypothetical protein